MSRCAYPPSSLDILTLAILTMPLYMHTILSILREMGSDEFNYRSYCSLPCQFMILIAFQIFRKRLEDPEFNKSQGAMLELRLDLLDSFLQGHGADVKLFSRLDASSLLIYQTPL
jgi:hypothetical protein